MENKAPFKKNIAITEAAKRIRCKMLGGSPLKGLAAVKIVCLAIQPPSILFYLFPCFIAFYQPFDPLVRVK